MATGFLRFVRSNTIALLALFIALGGTTYAATALPANSVGAKQLKKNAVTPVKIKASAVTNAKIGANAVTGAKVKDDSLTGADILESSLGKVPAAAAADSATNATHATTAGSAAPSGAAGGSLAGTYPNPTLAPGAVHAAQLGTINDRTSFTSVAAGAFGSASVQCAAGERIIAGGNDGFSGMPVAASRFASPNGWAVFANNTNASASNLTVHAYCLAP
jgi:hypothetical protein